jgi:hypothetical protein
MASSSEIEKNVIDDVKAILDAASISDVITEADTRPEKATWVKVSCLRLRGNLPGGTLPSGMRQADVSIEAHSYYDDDTDGSALATLAGSIRDVIWRDDVLTKFNSASSYNTYYGMTAGDDLPDNEDRFRIRAIQVSLIMKPAQ